MVPEVIVLGYSVSRVVIEPQMTWSREGRGKILLQMLKSRWSGVHFVGANLSEADEACGGCGSNRRLHDEHW